MSEWQPIDTAPSEGVFLVFVEDVTLGSNVWPMRRRHGIVTIGSVFQSDFGSTATHWMPLPEGPKND